MCSGLRSLQQANFWNSMWPTGKSGGEQRSSGLSRVQQLDRVTVVIGIGDRQGRREDPSGYKVKVQRSGTLKMIFVPASYAKAVFDTCYFTSFLHHFYTCSTKRSRQGRAL